MRDDNESLGHVAASAMLDAFASVGAERFDVTRTTRAEEKEYFRRSVALTELRTAMPRLLDTAVEHQLNVIVRPRGSQVTFIQLDDLKGPALVSVTPAVFLVLQTSPGNFQAWAAIDGIVDEAFTRRLRKGTGADRTASGATRVAGSLNFKDKYAPNFPRVAIHHTDLGNKVATAELERLGLIAEPEPLRRFDKVPSPITGGNRKWPSYAIALERAPLNNEKTGPDTSSADIAWCMTAITWGWSVEDTTRRLLDQSESKASVRGLKYAEATARKAALFVDQRKLQPRQRRLIDHGQR